MSEEVEFTQVCSRCGDKDIQKAAVQQVKRCFSSLPIKKTLNERDQRATSANSLPPLEKVQKENEVGHIDPKQNSPVVSMWHFSEACTPWKKFNAPLSNVAPCLRSIDSLRYEGFYNYDDQHWSRHYITREGIVLKLLEDVPEAGGQNCLWAAGLVMARYFEMIPRDNLRGKTVLELGSGAGLTSLIAALCVGRNGEVYATEQNSCLPYLKKNLALNPNISVNVKKLHWTNTCGDEMKFDVIFGCDITYDVNNFDGIFTTIRKCLRKPCGLVYICHDNDSCPLSALAFSNLREQAKDNDMTIQEVCYESIVGKSFYSDSVKLWCMSFT